MALVVVIEIAVDGDAGPEIAVHLGGPGIELRVPVDPDMAEGRQESGVRRQESGDSRSLTPDP